MSLISQRSSRIDAIKGRTKSPLEQREIKVNLLRIKIDERSQLVHAEFERVNQSILTKIKILVKSWV